MKAWWAALASLVVAMIVAIAVYSMPLGQSMDAAAEGAVFGFFPIMWIVINALWIYNMTHESGHFAILRQSFSAVSSDEGVQAVIIGFSFGALLEALAGFGTPVAICSVMLIALGFKPMKAVVVALVADTAPVAFGAIAIPIVTLSQLTGISQHDLGSMVGRQTPFLALIIPFVLVAVVDGWRGIRQAWPAALVGSPPSRCKAASPVRVPRSQARRFTRPRSSRRWRSVSARVERLRARSYAHTRPTSSSSPCWASRS